MDPDLAVTFIDPAVNLVYRVVLLDRHLDPDRQPGFPPRAHLWSAPPADTVDGALDKALDHFAGHRSRWAMEETVWLRSSSGTRPLLSRLIAYEDEPGAWDLE